jgi:hypothetical protein
VKNITNILLFVSLSIFIWQCGRPGAPSGGPKDTAGPKIIKAYPPNQSANFKGNKVELKFDEFIQLKSLNQEFVISPPMKNPPIFKVVGKKLIIEFQDTLYPNTTYSMFFGKGIVDFNESNPLDSNLWVFSTGNYLDSLECSGTIQDAFLSTAEEKMLVGLYPYGAVQDSVPSKSLPRYFSSIKEGKFKFQNIAPGNYLLFALQDMNNNYLYDLPTEKIAFHQQPIKISANESSDSLKLFSSLPIPKELKFEETKLVDGTYIYGKANQPFFETPKISLLGDSISIDSIYFNKLTSEIFAFLSNKARGGISIVFEEKDTLKLRPEKESKNWLSADFKTTTGNSSTATIQFSKNKAFDAVADSLVLLFLDSILIDTSKYSLLSEKEKLMINHPWKESSEYKIVFLPGAFSNQYNQTNSDSIQFSIPFTADANWGIMTLNYEMPGSEGAYSKSFILELIEGEEVVRRAIVTDFSKGSITWKGLSTKPHQIRCIYDANGDGFWTPGNYYSETNPEYVIYFKESITLRPNWELDINWKIE